MRIAAIDSFLLTVVLLTFSAATFGQFGISITIAPPELISYQQPICPGDGYIWTPGYWAYGDEGYYWVPGTWVEPPEVGLLWTPGYWYWEDTGYVWNPGYWGPQVGFYGGIDYGFGYDGVGYQGGYWNGNRFFYNRYVNHVNGSIRNVYEKRVVDRHNRVAFNGGHGGVNVRPTREQETFAHEHHVDATSAQSQHQQAARADRSQYVSVNHGRPAVGATAKPGEFGGAGGEPARGSTFGRTNRNESPTGSNPPINRTTRTEPSRGLNAPADRTTRTEPSRGLNAPADRTTRTEPSRGLNPPPDRTTRTESSRGSNPPAERAPRTEPSRGSNAPAERPTRTAPANESKPPAERAARPEPSHESRPPAEHAAPPQHDAAPREDERKPH